MLDATELDAKRSREALARIVCEAREAGLLQPAAGALAARALGAGFALVVLLALSWTAQSMALALVAAGGAGLACIQLGFIAHDAGHGAVSRSRGANALAGHLAFTVVNGLGFESWRESHSAHHAFCQDESRDPDMAVDVVMSLTPAAAARKRGLARRLLPYQGFALWPLSLLFAFSLRVQSLLRACRAPARHPGDAILLPLHYVAWFAVPWAVFEVGFGRATAVYLVASAAMGVYLAVLFWTNHIGMPALAEGHSLTRLEQQVVGTRNVRHARWLDFAFGGLDFQIEHHLVPSASSARLRAIQPITRRHCLEAGLPYHEESPGRALLSVTRHVQRIARECAD